MTSLLPFLLSVSAFANVALMDATGVRKIVYEGTDPNSGSAEIRLRVCPSRVRLEEVTPTCVGKNGKPIDEVAVPQHVWVEEAEALAEKLKVNFSKLAENVSFPHHEKGHRPIEIKKSSEPEWKVATQAFGRKTSPAGGTGDLVTNINPNIQIHNGPVGAGAAQTSTAYECSGVCRYTTVTRSNYIPGLPEYIPPPPRTSSASPSVKKSLRAANLKEAEEKAKEVLKTECDSHCKSTSDRYVSQTMSGCRVEGISCL